MEDSRATIKTLIELDEHEQALTQARDAAKRLFDVADAMLKELEKASQPKPKEEDDIKA